MVVDLFFLFVILLTAAARAGLVPGQVVAVAGQLLQGLHPVPKDDDRIVRVQIGQVHGTATIHDVDFGLEGIEQTAAAVVVVVLSSIILRQSVILRLWLFFKQPRQVAIGSEVEQDHGAHVTTTTQQQ